MEIEIMNYSEFSEAINDAENVMAKADRAAETFARLLIGRLRKVGNHNTLCKLKKELTKYNMQKFQWKD